MKSCFSNLAKNLSFDKGLRCLSVAVFVGLCASLGNIYKINDPKMARILPSLDRLK